MFLELLVIGGVDNPFALLEMHNVRKELRSAFLAQFLTAGDAWQKWPRVGPLTQR
jgi:hypothetical protein